MAQNGLGIIGAGNMGGAITGGVLKAGLFKPRQVVVYDLVSEKAEILSRALGVGLARSGTEAARDASTVLLAVKPQNMEECLSGLKNALTSYHLIISIAAGITTGFIENHLEDGARVVRVMPNTPALAGAGVSAICSGRHATVEDLDEAERIFAAMGKVYRFPESLMDAVTAISGSGPAYLFLFAESLERAALECGLPADTAPDMVAHTLLGASKLLVESGEGAPTLRARVTSPGGTTEAALSVLKERGFEEMMVAAVIRALERAKELGGVKKN